MKLRILLTLAALVLIGLAVFTVVSGRPPARRLPVPNGFDDFTTAAKLISAVPASSADWQQLDPKALESLVASNAPALALVRTGLTRQCLAPLITSRTNMEAHMERLGMWKRLGQAFCAESRLAALQGRTNTAALSALDCIRFGQEGARGGSLIQSLVGISIRAIGISELNRHLNSLDAATLKQLAGSLEALLASRETKAEVVANEEMFVRSAFPLSQRIAGRIVNWTSGNQSVLQTSQKIDADAQGLARTMLDCAVRAYELEQGRPPQNVKNLVPQYLKTAPTDPVTGQPILLPRGR